MLALIPALDPEERTRVSEYLKSSQPNAEAVHQALVREK